MKKQFYFLCFLLTVSSFISAQEMPEKGTPIKYGKFLLYFNWNSSGDSTELNFELYDNLFHKQNEYKVVVDYVGKFSSILTVFDEVPGSEWMEILLQEKLIVSSSLVVRVNADFKIVNRYVFDKKASNAFDRENLSISPVNYIPLDHSFGYLGMGFQDMDVRMADGSMIYLNYDLSLAFSSTPSDHSKLNAKVMPTTLCYFQAGEKDYTIKWKLNIKDIHIAAYRIYLFGNDLFLYTSYFIGDSKNVSSEQMIRKIELNTGKIIYEVKLESKPNFELMLSNATYDNVSKNFVFCGNYMTTLPTKEQKKATGNLSSFFLAKIDQNGKYTTKDVEINAEKPKDVKSDYLQAPFLCVRELHLNKNGQYVAMAQYNYQLPKWFAYTTYGAPTSGAVEDGSYKALVGGLSFIVFDPALNLISQETNMIASTTKNSLFVVYDGYTPEVITLGTKAGDKWASFSCAWNPENESGVITYVDRNRTPGGKGASLYVLKVNSSEKEYCKVVEKIPDDDKGVFTVLLMDPTILIYYVTGQTNKNSFVKIDL